MTTPPNKTVVDTTASPHARLRPLPLDGASVTLTDAFWQPRRVLNRTATLPGQFRRLEESGCLGNFRRRAARLYDTPSKPPQFHDTDLYKWLEAASAALAEDADPELAALVEQAVALVEGAQEADGYLNTNSAMDDPANRWKGLSWSHEHYNAGHFFQAAVAHYRATGGEDTRLLTVARRFADLLAETFGPAAEGKREVVDGHQEVELGLIELFRVSGERRYLDLAAFFLEARGRVTIPGLHDPEYCQNRVPLREMPDVSTGHAVRAMYYFAGATDLYAENGDATLLTALERLWEQMTARRLYVTGGLGSRHDWESIGLDYELPNARAYTETCAAIGSVMWNARMLLVTGAARCADLLEWTLYNAVLPGISLDGQEYFYENPLADDGGGSAHRRKGWFGCACCPPNVARLLAQLPGYVAAVEGDAVCLNLYAAGRVAATLAGGRRVTFSVETAYPWDGDITLRVETDGDFALRLRVPAWCDGGEDPPALSVNGEPVAGAAADPGSWVEVRRTWKSGDTLRLSLPMPVVYREAHPYVTEDRGRVAVTRGPLVYCLEQTDLPEGTDVRDVVLPRDPSALAPQGADWLPGGGVMLAGRGSAAAPGAGWSGHLYLPRRATAPATAAPVPLTLVPYFAWANRTPGGMQVWLPAS